MVTPRHCQGLDSIVACVGVCRLVLRQNQLSLHMQHAIVWVLAEMPAQSRLWLWASRALMTVLEISITLSVLQPVCSIFVVLRFTRDYR
jgi:hypothetical protein